jgi:ATP-dependent RNA helicase RhlE
MNDFSELPLSIAIKSNLTRHGFVQPTAVQAQAIPPALAGRDVLATAQTGTGKTLAFVLPLLESLLATRRVGVHALILCPTRELAIQIHDTFEKLAAGTGMRAAVCVGGMNEQAQLKAIRGGANVVIATPGRLCDFLDRKLVKLGSTGMLILDEADRMLDMGFLPSIRRILSEVPAARQTLCFSATIEKSVAHLIDGHLNNPVRIGIDVRSAPVAKVDLNVYEVEQDGKLGLLRTILTGEPGSVLVFVRTKHGADRLAKNLSAIGLHAARIHGDRTQNQRNQALAGFQNGDYRVLVATDVAARGIHVDAIAHVINYDLPQVPEDFIHRVGRTGRAGATGVASTFATRSERGDIGRIEKALKVRLERRSVPAAATEKVVILPVKTAVYQPNRNRRASGTR